MSLTEKQKQLQVQIADAKATTEMAEDSYRSLKKQCVEHVYEKDRCELAVCVICGDSGGWWCPDSPNHTCEYIDSEYCIYCGNPEERL